MKKFPCALLLLAAIIIFADCKKENTKQEDISILFKNTEWTGEMKYVNRPVAEPFTIEFSENGTLKWHEYSGNYNGAYAIDAPKREIKFHLTGIKDTFNANVAQDKKFSNISHPAMLSCELNNSGKENLDNTIWSGRYENGLPIELNFKPGQLIYQSMVGHVPYEKLGTAIRFGDLYNSFFCVLQADNKTIKGFTESRYPYSETHSFELTKQ